MEQQNFTPQQALSKIKNYCAYQERCHSEVKDKLYSYGLHKNDVDDILCKLIEENYLNEERFAILFAGGKFRIKQWGRIKIKYELKQKQVSDYCIKKALAAIDEADYLKTLDKLFQLQLKRLKGERNFFIKRRKLQDHLKMKGFENDLITRMISKTKE
ncbi:MAG: regulatory protein RecX [Ferruginibacter sp.]